MACTTSVADFSYEATEYVNDVASLEPAVLIAYVRCTVCSSELWHGFSPSVLTLVCAGGPSDVLRDLNPVPRYRGSPRLEIPKTAPSSSHLRVEFRVDH